jgi:predicted dehydrogenase
MIRAGIVGCGIWGQTLVKSVQDKSDRIRFVRGMTRTPSKAEAFGAEMDIPIDDDYAAMLADPDVDAVVLATPHSQHGDQILQAAAAGKHVFVEKPLALDAETAARAYAACRDAGVVLALGHNRRCLPSYLRLKEMIADGALGQITHLEGNFSGPSAFRQTPDNWRADLSESPAGGMTGKGIHITDMMIDLAGSARSVATLSQRQVLSYGMDDTTLVTIRFASGQTGSLSTLTTTPNDWRLQVYGTDAWVEIRDHTRMRIRLRSGDETVEDFDAEDIEKAILERFADTVEHGAPFPVTEAEAIANTALLEAIVTGIRNGDGLPVDLPHDVASRSGECS